MGHRQKGKGHKRQKSWHRGRSEAKRFGRVALPELGTGADPTTGAPTPVPRRPGPNRMHGESV